MKRFKNILRKCPYIVVLLITWLFMTIGGVALIFYRDYYSFEWDSFFSEPFFAAVMEDEIDGMAHGESEKPRIAKAVMANLGSVSYAGSESGSVNSGKTAADTEISENTSNNKITDVTEESLKNNEITSVIPDIVPKKIRYRLNFIRRFAAAKSSWEGMMTEPAEAADEGEGKPGQTLFTEYEPVETDSIYYSDAGKVALTTDYPYVTVGEDYFDDAVFFGDSRTLGISDYSGLNADFFCENGMTIYKLLDEKGVVYRKTGEKADLNRVLQEKKYGKIYIMLGMNELGYGNTAQYLEQYSKVLAQLRLWQPDSIIYVMSNLHVSRSKDDPTTEFNNININDKNAASATLANGTDVIYLDINPLFTDNDGYLKDELTFDGVHLYADGYMKWKEFLMEHGVVR